MQVSVESTGALERRMTVAVPADQFEQAFSDRLRRLSRSVKMAGFRPGKVPLKMVEAQYGQQVLQEVAGDLINSSFQQAVGQQGLKPAGGPTIEPRSLDRGKDLEYTATFEVYPEIKAPSLAGVRIERPTSTVGDADVDRTLERMRQQQVEWQPVAEAAADGHRVTMDFSGSLDGKEVPGTSATGYRVELGKKALVPDFERQLIGMKEGDQRQIDVVFPDDYGNKDLAGKTVNFDVKVTAVEKALLPEVDDAFAHRFGVKDGGVATLRDEVRANLNRELEDRVRLLVRDRVMNALVEANQIELPRQLVEQEAGNLLAANRRALQQAGMPEDRLPKDPQPYMDQSRRRVLLGLLLSEAGRQFDLRPDPARVKTTLEHTAASYEDPAEFVKWHYADKRRLAEVEAVVMEEMIIERLLEQADVVDVPQEFSDLMYASKASEISRKKEEKGS